jgi:hypothetical protein
VERRLFGVLLAGFLCLVLPAAAAVVVVVVGVERAGLVGGVSVARCWVLRDQVALALWVGVGVSGFSGVFVV